MPIFRVFFFQILFLIYIFLISFNLLRLFCADPSHKIRFEYIKITVWKKPRVVNTFALTFLYIFYTNTCEHSLIAFLMFIVEETSKLVSESVGVKYI